MQKQKDCLRRHTFLSWIYKNSHRNNLKPNSKTYQLLMKMCPPQLTHRCKERKTYFYCVVESSPEIHSCIGTENFLMFEELLNIKNYSILISYQKGKNISNSSSRNKYQVIPLIKTFCCKKKGICEKHVNVSAQQ